MQLGRWKVWPFLATDPKKTGIVYAEPFSKTSQCDVEGEDAVNIKMGRG